MYGKELFRRIREVRTDKRSWNTYEDSRLRRGVRTHKVSADGEEDCGRISKLDGKTEGQGKGKLIKRVRIRDVRTDKKSGDGEEECGRIREI